MSNRDPGRTSAPRGRAPHEGPGEPPASPAEPSSAHAAGAEGEVPVQLTVRAGERAEHLFRRLLSAYLGGVPSIRLRELPRISAPTRDVVREFCRRTRGLQLVHEDARTVELTEPDRPGTGAPDAELLELGERVLAIHREAVESWGALAFGDDATWERKDDDIDREAWYLERRITVAEGRGGLARPLTRTWTVARSLERIADHAVTLGEVGPRLAELDPGSSLLRELRQYHQQAMAHLEAVLEGPDGSQANDLLDVGEALAQGGRALAERLLPAVGDGSMTPALAASISRALEAVGRTIAYTQDIAQAFLDRSAPTGRPPTAPLSPPMAVGAPG